MKRNKEGEELFDVKAFFELYKNTVRAYSVTKTKYLVIKPNKISQTQLLRSKGIR
jgi:hypothetical protein